MSKTHWFTLVFALGLLAAIAAIPGEGLAQPVSVRTHPAAIQSPILGPFINIWLDGVNNSEPAIA